jgi:hypothetical protein
LGYYLKGGLHWEFIQDAMALYAQAEYINAVVGGNTFEGTLSNGNSTDTRTLISFGVEFISLSR